MVNILGHVLESDIHSVLYSTYAPLTAIYVLAIHLVKNPSGESVNMDLEVQLPRNAINFC
jgi:hypothetical protein